MISGFGSTDEFVLLSGVLDAITAGSEASERGVGRFGGEALFQKSAPIISELSPWHTHVTGDRLKHGKDTRCQEGSACPR